MHTCGTSQQDSLRQLIDEMDGQSLWTKLPLYWEVEPPLHLKATITQEYLVIRYMLLSTIF